MSMPRNLSWGVSMAIFVFGILAFDPPVLVTSLKHKNMLCDKVQECVCRFPTGEGINLTALASKSLVYNDTLGSVFYLNPCNEYIPECSHNASFCVLHEKTNETVDLGYKGSPTFSSEGLMGLAFLNYDFNGSKLEVQLECTPTPETILLNNSDVDLERINEVKYHLILRSPEACLKTVEYLKTDDANEGLSSGSVFFIILLVSFCTYFLVGAAVNRFLHGATGWEIIPNFEFWKNLPNAILDGLKYIANGCKAPPSYEQI